jgi:hypothetical protein
MAVKKRSLLSQGIHSLARNHRESTGCQTKGFGKGELLMVPHRGKWLDEAAGRGQTGGLRP